MQRNARLSTPWVKRWAPFATLAVIATLAMLSSVDTTQAFAQVGKGKQKDTKKVDGKKKAQIITRAIPGTGTTQSVAELSKIIDAEIALRLKAEGIKSSPICDDSEFVRRVHLDITGVIPTTEQVKAFLASKDPNRRAKLVDELLADGKYSKQMAEIWANLMIPTDSANRNLVSVNLRKWLEEAFDKNVPWNKLVSDVITASGNVDDNGATIYFVANSTVDKVTDQTSKLFLGIQLQCAQCHNHPFTSWKQTEYWGMAAFFMKVKQTGNPQAVAKSGGTITIEEAPFVAKGKKGLPESAKIVPAKFLGAEEPKLDKAGPARPALAKWMTADDNPYFAKAMVNRTWAHFFGRGFVNAIDDMHDENPATHPELLVALSEQFKRNNYDLKFLIKAIVLSDTYQRTSKPFEDNGEDSELFSRMYIKSMSPEQLYDSIVQVVGQGKGAFAPGAKKPLADKKGPKGPRDQFINFFRVDEGGDPLEYQAGIPQALRMMNSPLLNNGGLALEQAMKIKAPVEVIEYLYLTTLSRPPTAAESQKLVAYVGKQKDLRTGYSDVLWALLNSSEFTLNH